MNRKVRTLLVVGLGLALLVGGGILGLRGALRHEPTFYREALSQKPAEQQAANDELLANATALASNARREGRWSALFTAAQINGWLALDVPQNFPDLLPKEISDPRVRLSKGKATIACRYHDSSITTVISLNVELYLAEPNVLALRIQNVRAGAIPIPLAQILDGVTKAAEDAALHLRWVKSEGDPVALVTLPPTLGRDKHGVCYRLETLDLRDDAIYMAGHTWKGPPGSNPPNKTALDQASLSQHPQR